MFILKVAYYIVLFIINFHGLYQKFLLPKPSKRPNAVFNNEQLVHRQSSM